MKILVVDDEKLLVKGIKFNLEQDGYAVVTAFDGEEAIRLAHDESIDLILLDLMLPKVDGFTVCRTTVSYTHLLHAICKTTRFRVKRLYRRITKHLKKCLKNRNQ